MKIVIDTNVIVSALMNANGIPAKIVALILSGEIKILYDNRIIFEYVDVLSRKEFGFNKEIIDSMIDYFKSDGELVNSRYVNGEFVDETDKKFYEVHKPGKSHYLITDNKKYFPERRHHNNAKRIYRNILVWRAASATGLSAATKTPAILKGRPGS
jgi:putative PIN family toxin of toxin-antitoxin system